MEQRGVLFNKDMVIACLTCAKCGKLSRDFPCHCGSTEFVKQQTRRIMQVQPIKDNWQIHSVIGDEKRNGETCFINPSSVMLQEGVTRTKYFRPKLGTAGDFLYVRETAKVCGCNSVRYCFRYTADGKLSKWLDLPSRIKPIELGHCCSNGAFKELASIWLKITGVRAERVQAISEADAKAEGVTQDILPIDDHGPERICYVTIPDDNHAYVTAKEAFEPIWQSCYPGSWERNDHVFVYEIERCEKP